jgi:hypothetical protein
LLNNRWSLPNLLRTRIFACWLLKRFLSSGHFIFSYCNHKSCASYSQIVFRFKTSSYEGEFYGTAEWCWMPWLEFTKRILLLALGIVTTNTFSVFTCPSSTARF